MDAFFIAVEMRDNPAIAHLPAAVGGTAAQRSVLCTANYRAREYGLHAGMATAHAQKLCPQLVLVPPSFGKYKQISENIQAIFKSYTPLVEPLSLDEAYLDVSEIGQNHAEAIGMASAIRQQIVESEGLTASAGIATNKLMAKVASGWNKPNGQCSVSAEETPAFVAQLPVQKIGGVGPKTAAKLHQIGISVCSDLEKVPYHQLIAQFGKLGTRLYQLCRGIDDSPVVASRPRKSVSIEETFMQDLDGLAPCQAALAHLYQRLVARLGQRAIKGVLIKIKFSDFQQTTMAQAGGALPLALFAALLEKGLRGTTKSVRLLGVGVRLREEAPASATQQLTLW
jgi:DNA polymerase-4